MKKMSIGFVAIIAIIFTLTGCGNKSLIILLQQQNQH
jgi:predicted small lipoprotein YifL